MCVIALSRLCMWCSLAKFISVISMGSE